MWGWRQLRERNTTSLKFPLLTWNYTLTYCQARDLTQCVRDGLTVCLPVCECERPGVCMRCRFYLTSQCVIARNPAIKQNMKYCIFITTFCKAVFSFSVETCFTSSRVFGKKRIFITETSTFYSSATRKDAKKNEFFVVFLYAFYKWTMLMHLWSHDANN